MKILLTTLNAKYVHSNLALKYLYAAASEFRSSLCITEFTINNDDDYIFAELCRGCFSVVCFSCYIWNIERILYLAENLKKAQPDIKIVLGGPEVSFDALTVMTENKYVDFVMSGEGEEAFKLLLESFLHKNNEFDKIKGLTYRRDGKIFVNASAAPVSFEGVPFPYEYLAGENDKTIYYESARGCPHRCSYCLSSIDKTIRALPLDRVRRELGYFLYKQVRQVKLVDRTFNWDSDRAIELVRFLIAGDNGVTNFHFELCGDTIDPKLISLLRSARKGLFQFEIGVQSTNESTLAACGRKSNFSKLRSNVREILDLGNIHVHLDLIAGLPGEDYKSFRKSVNDVYEIGAQQLQLGFLKLLKGSPLRNQAESYGYIYRRKPPYEVISNDCMSAAELIKLKMIENVLDLYYNRGGFESTLEFAMAVFQETPFDFYEHFSAFFYEKGFQHKPHKKEDLYRILLAYAGSRNEFHGGTQARIKELLAGDMVRTLNEDAVKKFKRKGWEIL